MAIIDRVELYPKSKSLKILNICGGIYLAVWVFMVMSAESFSSDDIKSLLMGAMYWALLGKLWSKDAGLFIEWREDHIEFKTHKGYGLIDIKKLKHLNIWLDEITAYLEKDEVTVINIERFTDYDTRIKIKNNFNHLQKQL